MWPGQEYVLKVSLKPKVSRELPELQLRQLLALPLLELVPSSLKLPQE